jgi:hypothetical protein
VAEPEHFVGVVVEKLMIYALGRGLAPQDMPTVRKIVRDAAEDDYRFSSLILGIANSTAFKMKQAEPAPAAGPTTAAAQ